MIVGLTGGIGSGKSTVGQIFKDLGVPVIDADVITHNILDNDSTVQQAVHDKLGASYLKTTGKLNKTKIKQQIFADPKSRIWLESLLHPLIKTEIIRQTNNITYLYCVVEIPLLIEAKMQNSVDRILTIDCPTELQLQRTLSRGKHSTNDIKAIINIQTTNKERVAVSDDVITNTEDFSALVNSVRQLHHLYLSMTI